MFTIFFPVFRSVHLTVSALTCSHRVSYYAHVFRCSRQGSQCTRASTRTTAWTTLSRWWRLTPAWTGGCRTTRTRTTWREPWASISRAQCRESFWLNKNIKACHSVSDFCFKISVVEPEPKEPQLFAVWNRTWNRNLNLSKSRNRNRNCLRFHNTV